MRKIKWDDEIDDPDRPTFCLTVDGTDFRQEEKQHPTYHRDEKEHTHKFKHCGCKFQLAISIWKSRVIAMDGPYRGGKSDNKIFLETLEEKIPVGKLDSRSWLQNVRQNKGEKAIDAEIHRFSAIEQLQITRPCTPGMF